ncbi:multidrug and toxin extrusion protein 1-like [Periophthalmus magnuspinnatus]|uniref:multidrug and toxin extrusion protein 1-like n=1 Tax=Periophthalmus magnuspinnatus TaxID=409849 RepID=UPI002436F44E|nr:multidrug and toxin extrusion protein 1-like [Periophthalmus magnuspinnatus]
MARSDVRYTEGAAECIAGDQKGYCGCGSQRITSCAPLNYRQEALQLLKLAGPVVISQMMVFLISIISVVFCGHLGKTELAAVSLAAAVVNVSGVSIGTGLSATCDTLISQTFGSGNLKRVGVILQRGVLILLLACFPCWAVLVNTEPLLLAVKQSPEVASLSQLYVEIFMPALPAAFMYQLQGKYLQNQGIMWPQVVTGAIGNIFNIIINYIFLHLLELGVAGSAVANAISQYILALLLFAYIIWKGLHKATWGGWSMDCLQEWGLFIRLAIPSMLMICLSWWIFEAGGFLAGIISENELGAHSIVYQLIIVAYMVPLGFSVAASVRVGNALGAGNVEQAKLSCKVPIICAFICACFVGGSLSLARCVIGYIFTTEHDIIQRVSEVMVLFVFMHIGDAIAGVAAGILRGAGKQLIGALCNLVALYLIGFPIGVSLMFAAKMGIMGLWTGMTICVCLQCTVFCTILYKLNWTKAAKEAFERSGIQIKKEQWNTEGPNLIHMGVGTESAEETEEEPSQNQKFTTTVGDILPKRALVVRRSLTLMLMIVILICGITASELLVTLFN